MAEGESHFRHDVEQFLKSISHLSLCLSLLCFLHPLLLEISTLYISTWHENCPWASPDFQLHCLAEYKENLCLKKPTCNCQDKILCSPAWILYPLLDQPLLMERLEFNVSLTRIESGLCTFVILLNREIIGAKPYNTDGEEDYSQRQKSSINMKENLLVLANYYSYGNNHYCFLR